MYHVPQDMILESIEIYLQENSSSTEQSRADLLSTPLPPISYKGRTYKAAQIRYTKKIKRITLMRYLCSKLVLKSDEITRLDLMLMYDNLIHLQDLCLKDENFRLKFGSDLESLAKLLKGFNLSPKSNKLNMRTLSSQMKQEITNFLYPLRNLSTVWTHVQKMYFVTEYIEQGRLRKFLPPKAYIGKGYTDKGTAKDPAYDGSPSWQTIASTYVNFEDMINETKTFDETTNFIFLERV